MHYENFSARYTHLQIGSYPLLQCEWTNLFSTECLLLQKFCWNRKKLWSEAFIAHTRSCSQIQSINQNWVNTQHFPLFAQIKAKCMFLPHWYNFSVCFLFKKCSSFFFFLTCRSIHRKKWIEDKRKKEIWIHKAPAVSASTEWALQEKMKSVK